MSVLKFTLLFLLSIITITLLISCDYQPYKQGRNQDKIACIIRYGLTDRILVNDKIYSQEMPGVKDLNDVQITNIINYVNHAWGNQLSHVKVEDLRKKLRDCND